MAKPKAKSKVGSPARLQLDRRAHKLALEDLHPDTSLSTKELAPILGVSTQWLEIARVHGYGPPFQQLSNRKITYIWGPTREWLYSRTRTCTSEYRREAR
jgi:hypothetical protein